MGLSVRRYRVKYILHSEEGRYEIKYKELRSLRDAGEFIKQVSETPTMEYGEIRVVSYSDLTAQESNMLEFFTDGVLKKS